MAEKHKSALGVNIVAGEAWFGLVECPDDPVLTDPLTKLARSQHQDPAPALLGFVDRLREELRRIRPAVVGVAPQNMRTVPT